MKTTYVVEYEMLGRRFSVEVWATSEAQARGWVKGSYPAALIIRSRRRVAI